MTYTIDTVKGDTRSTCRNYKTLDGAMKALRGLKRMARRYVFVHREQQVFYAKTAADYKRGNYTMLSYFR